MFGRSSGPKTQVAAARLLRIASSDPWVIFIQGDDGNLYQVQLVPEDQRNNASANAWVFGSMAREVGLPINPQQALLVPNELLRNSPLTEQKLRRKLSAGKDKRYLADRIVGPGCGPLRPFSFLVETDARCVTNRRDFLGMYLFDIWAERNVPRTALFRRTGRGRDIQATFNNDGKQSDGHDWSAADAAGCLCSQAFSLYSGLWDTAATRSWLELFRNRLPSSLVQAIASLPPYWELPDEERFRARLLQRLDALPGLVNAYPLNNASFNRPVDVPSWSGRHLSLLD